MSGAAPRVRQSAADFLSGSAVVASVLFIVAELLFLIQLTEVGINFLAPGSGGLLSTGQFFSWAIVFLSILAVAVLLRLFLGLLNRLAALGLGRLFVLGIAPEERDSTRAVGFAGALVWILWLIGTIPLTALSMAFFHSRPELNGWLADGSWLATGLVYLGILGLVAHGASTRSKLVERL